MDNARFVLIVFFFFLSIMLYQQWQADYGPKPAASSSQAGVSPAANPDVPVSADAAGSPESTSAQTENLISRQRILVKTDVVRMEIDTEGGDIRLLELLDYPVAKDAPNSPVQLFTDKDLVFVAQNGFIGDEATAPNHHSQWQAQATSFALAEGQNELRVPLTWTSPQGVTVTKTYIL
ncbi:MAG: hypothetical protein RL661_1492, partial [Pseudomonadota bacterium]